MTTAITNLDIHDIARAAKTFGLASYYLVTPVDEQRALAERVRQHWTEGWGASYNPKRREALELVKLTTDLRGVLDDMLSRFGKPPVIVVTGARKRPNSISYPELTSRMKDPEQCWLLLFGTGWGLTEEITELADLVLDPVIGTQEYNHLSVRSAVSIILDRLLGR